MLPVSVFIIAKNEADRIGATIRAIRGLTDDIVVVDSGSTDGTQAVAEELGARVIFNPWPGYGLQKRFAEDQCRYDWLLNLDADEEVSPELLAEIRRLFASGEPPCQAYGIRIAETYPGERAPHPLAYRIAPVRLYHQDSGRYSSSLVHDRVDLKPKTKVGKLKGLVHHRSVRSLGDQLAKLNSYADQQAVDLEVRGVSIPTWRVYFEFPAAFLKVYFGRLHFLRGTYGFLISMNYATWRHLRLAKHYERKRLGALAKSDARAKRVKA
ncbi:glycosyltransferase family 2 protein [Microvirga sp. 2MCAF35]|uniref:glycosyltransferase family 2 protein n=1 Tax=Microvirga sp. 2MCAF35 TaxID=3232987 RepID=UPI003F9B8D70